MSIAVRKAATRRPAAKSLWLTSKKHRARRCRIPAARGRWAKHLRATASIGEHCALGRSISSVGRRPREPDIRDDHVWLGYPMSGPSPDPEQLKPAPGLARHAAINLLGGVFTPVASFASAPILAHALSVDGRGELAAATMPLILTVTLATIGLPEAVTFFVAQDRRRTRPLIFRSALLVLLPAAIASAALILSSSWISAGNPTVQRIIVVSTFLVAPSLLLCVVRAAAAAHNKWTIITIERVITATTKLIPLIILFMMGELDLVSAAVVTIASTLTGVIAYVPLLATLRRGPSISNVANTELLRFGGGIWIGAISGILLMRVDQVLLSPIAGAFELGLYVVAVSISEVPLMVNSAIRETAFTHLSYQGVRSDVVGDLSRVSTIIVFALCLPVAVLSPVVVPLLFGGDFSDSIPVLLLLLLAICTSNPGSIAGVGLSSSGLPHLRSLGLVVACFVNIAFVLLLAPSLGAVGAALATLLGNITASNMCIAWMIKRRGATLRDYYGFKSSDFVKVWGLILRGFARLAKRAKTA